ncbi:MAG: rhodanese-like domain-containing protein [Hyphomonadaceae bacterium]
MNVSRRAAVTCAIGAVGAWSLTYRDAGAWPLTPPRSLEEIARRLEASYPAIAHTPPPALAALIAANAPLLLVDVREGEEYEVGHLVGAERVDPGAARERVIAQLAGRALGRDVCFYCSVGQRSSRMAAEVRASMLDHGARRVHNLRAGVFAWHNQARPLADRFGATPFVHPYNEAWRRLLERPQWTAFAPRERG